MYTIARRFHLFAGHIGNAETTARRCDLLARRVFVGYHSFLRYLCLDLFLVGLQFGVKVGTLWSFGKLIASAIEHSAALRNILGNCRIICRVNGCQICGIM